MVEEGWWRRSRRVVVEEGGGGGLVLSDGGCKFAGLHAWLQASNSHLEVAHNDCDLCACDDEDHDHHEQEAEDVVVPVAHATQGTAQSAVGANTYMAAVRCVSCEAARRCARRGHVLVIPHRREDEE